MSRHVRPFVAVVVVLVAFASGSATAFAAEWSPPVEGGSVALGFGAAYPGGTHRGVDIVAAPGAGVSAPAAGTVSFAGQVPADGGGTCAAVTLELADGRRMSLLPLEAADVVIGECIEAGQAIGSLAASGDDSSPVTHLHVSLRSGDLYLDPGDLVSSAVAVAVEPPAAPASPPVDLSGGVGGGTPASVPAFAAATPPASTVVSAGPVQSGASTASMVARPEPAAPRVACMADIEDSGVPVTSGLMPASWQATSRDVPVFAPLDPRVATGVGLACAMIAAASGIVLSRRAQPVRVD